MTTVRPLDSRPVRDKQTACPQTLTISYLLFSKSTASDFEIHN